MIAIQEHISLAPFTTLRVGGEARFFCQPASEADTVEALAWARQRGLPVFILGGGSNLLVSDAGFDGLVMRMALAGIETRDAIHNQGSRRIYSAGAGVEWDALVARAVADNCAGVECLSGIPGTVGGTPIQNVGAYGQDVSESVVTVEAIEAATLQPVRFSNAECEFRYRHSRFNTNDLGRYIVTRVEFALRPGGRPKLAYAELERQFSGQDLPALAAVRQAVLAIRRAKGMVVDEDDPDSRSAGSFFQNPIVTQSEYEKIASASSLPVPHFAAAEGQTKLAAAWLIEQSGLHKGFALGKAGISSKHTLALVNRGGARADDIVTLMEFVQRRVHERFGIALRPEPVMLGYGER